MWVTSERSRQAALGSRSSDLPKNCSVSDGSSARAVRPNSWVPRAPAWRPLFLQGCPPQHRGRVLRVLHGATVTHHTRTRCMRRLEKLQRHMKQSVGPCAFEAEARAQL